MASTQSEIRFVLIAVAAIVPALLWWKPAPAPAPAAGDRTPPRDQPARTGVSRQVEGILVRFREWETLTAAAAADPVAEDMKILVTEMNCAPLVRALPPNLLETPVGLMALECWAARDRIGAAGWLSQQPNPTPFQIGTVLRGWLAKNREELHGYVDGLALDPWKEMVLAELTTDATRHQEGLDAVLFARQMVPGDGQSRALGEAMLVWGKTDPEASSEWIGRIEDPALRERLVGMNAIGYAMVDPRAAVDWLRQSLPPGEHLNRVMGDVVSVWVGEAKPEEAAAWVAELPEGGLRDASVRKLIERWRGFNPDAVVAWIDSLPPGTLRDRAEDHLTAATERF